MIRRLVPAALIVAFVLPAGADAAIRVWATTPDREANLSRQHDVRFTKRPGSADSTITVHARRRLQRIHGFGAAITDSSALLLSKLPAAKRHLVLVRLLTRRRHGIGLDVMRVPMGASDFTASGMYSYDDRPPGETDPKLAHFSIAHDRAYILPVLREALRINPRLRIIANPWSPPAWMKTNDSMLGAGPSGPGMLRPDAYGPLADYFVRFIKAYRRAGVPIWAVTPQNEPQQPTADYPGMLMTAPEESMFSRDYLSPGLKKAGLGRVRVYGYDYVWLGSEAYVGALMSGATADSLDGIAYHCYFGAPESMSSFHADFPAKDIIEDECSTGISVLSPIQVVLRSVQNWASAVQMWNLALDPSGGPKIGSGCFNCIGVVTVDPDSGKVRPTGNYFELGQASRFVRPGARRIGIDASPALPACANDPVCGVEAAAFRNPNGSIALVVANSGPATKIAVRRPNGSGFTYSLPQQEPPAGTDNSRDEGVATFLWR